MFQSSGQHNILPNVVVLIFNSEKLRSLVKILFISVLPKASHFLQ